MICNCVTWSNPPTDDLPLNYLSIYDLLLLLITWTNKIKVNQFPNYRTARVHKSLSNRPLDLFWFPPVRFPSHQRNLSICLSCLWVNLHSPRHVKSLCSCTVSSEASLVVYLDFELIEMHKRLLWCRLKKLSSNRFLLSLNYLQKLMVTLNGEED